MKLGDHEALRDLFNDALNWLPPESASDDPAEAWRKVTADESHAWRVARDARLVERFAAVLERSRLSVERDLEYTTAYEPSTLQGREADPTGLH